MAVLTEAELRARALRPLEERVAIVTGGARGIGLAIAERLASLGAAVCLSDIDGAEAERAAGGIEDAGARAMGMAADVARVEDCRRVAEAAAERFGGVDLLINNAGLTRDAMVHRMTDDQWDIVQDVILRGAFNCVRAAAPWFRDRERSAPRRIVNIASVAGIYGSVGNTNYAAAKAGLIGFTLSMAKEWAGFGVTVNAVAPGFVETRLTAARERPGEAFGIPSEIRDALVARIPVGRAGTPDDVAAAVAYFCSPEAGYVTGQVLEVHGGMADITVTA